MAQFSRYGIIRGINTTGVNDVYLSMYSEAKSLKRYFEACGAVGLEIFFALVGDRVQAEEIVGGPDACPDKLPWYIGEKGRSFACNAANAIGVLKSGQPNIVEATQRVLGDLGISWQFVSAPDWRFQADVAAHQAQMQACGL
jgi:hypothetical protein